MNPLTMGIGFCHTMSRLIIIFDNYLHSHFEQKGTRMNVK